MQNGSAKVDVAVCVTSQRDCDRLINAGREFAQQAGCDFVVMSAQPRLYDEETAQTLEYLYSCSAQAGAEMLVMYTDKPMEALTKGLKERGVSNVIMGRPGRRSNQMTTRLMYTYTDAKYYMLDGNDQLYPSDGAMKRAL